MDIFEANNTIEIDNIIYSDIPETLTSITLGEEWEVYGEDDMNLQQDDQNIENISKMNPSMQLLAHGLQDNFLAPTPNITFHRMQNRIYTNISTDFSYCLDNCRLFDDPIPEYVINIVKNDLDNNITYSKIKHVLITRNLTQYLDLVKHIYGKIYKLSPDVENKLKDRLKKAPEKFTSTDRLFDDCWYRICRDNGWIYQSSF